jgi:hypothetical protein
VSLLAIAVGRADMGERERCLDAPRGWPEPARLAWACVLLLGYACIAEEARCQQATPGEPQRIFQATLAPTFASALDSLQQAFRNGDWKTLQSRMREFRDRSAGLKETLKPETHYYIVVLVGGDVRGKAELLRFLWHEPAGPEYALRLPGLEKGERVYELFMSEGLMDYRSRYSITLEPNPIATEASEFVLKLDPSRWLDRVLADRLKPNVVPESVYVHTTVAARESIDVVAFELPEIKERAVVEAENSVRRYPSIGAMELGIELASRAAWHYEASGCCKAYIDTISNEFERLDAVLKLAKQRIAPEQLWPMARKAVERARKTYRVWMPDSCSEEVPAIIDADRQIDEVLKNDRTTTTESKYKVVNRPLRTVGFGVISGFVLKDWSDSGAKLDGNNQALYTGPGVLPIFALNWHPWKYDPELLHPGPGEEWRIFVGGVVAPDPGLTAGLGWMPFRGLSVNAGWGIVFIPKLKDGETYGEPPDDKKDPFDTGTRRFVFAGIGYNWGKL